MKDSKLVSKHELQLALRSSTSKAEVLRLFNLRPTGGNYKTLKKYIKLYKLDDSNLKGQGWRKDKTFPNEKKGKDISLFLMENTPCNSNHLKKRLIKEGLKTAKCEKCNLTKWMGKKIPLELNHINGINDDNRLINLEIICPNCHAQTKHYRGASKKVSARIERREVEYRKFRETLTHNGDGNPEPSLNSNIKEGAETLHGTPKF